MYTIEHYKDNKLAYISTIYPTLEVLTSINFTHIIVYLN